LPCPLIKKKDAQFISKKSGKNHRQHHGATPMRQNEVQVQLVKNLSFPTSVPWAEQAKLGYAFLPMRPCLLGFTLHVIGYHVSVGHKEKKGMVRRQKNRTVI
jgi:hypothetical protein